MTDQSRRSFLRQGSILVASAAVISYAPAIITSRGVYRGPAAGYRIPGSIDGDSGIVIADTRLGRYSEELEAEIRRALASPQMIKRYSDSLKAEISRPSYLSQYLAK